MLYNQHVEGDLSISLKNYITVDNERLHLR
jgi:hypothetical protein